MSKIILKNSYEIDLIKKSAQIVSKTLGMLANEIKPGISSLKLDKLAEIFIRDHGAEPGFLGLYDFPNTLCVSPNSQVVHGIPNKELLKNGDILSIDCGVLYNGFYGDHAYTFEVGDVKPEVKKLLKISKESLYKGISEFKIGNRIGDIGFAIQKYNEKEGYGIVRELVGHGIGTKLHEEPQIPNYGNSGTGPLIDVGMCFAIEPMINMGTKDVYTKGDGWTICTKDGMPSAHFEHTITVTDNGPKVLTK